MANVIRRGNSWRIIAQLGCDDLGRQIRRTKTIDGGLSKTGAYRRRLLRGRPLPLNGNY